MIYGHGMGYWYLKSLRTGRHGPFFVDLPWFTVFKHGDFQ